MQGSITLAGVRTHGLNALTYARENARNGQKLPSTIEPQADWTLAFGIDDSYHSLSVHVSPVDRVLGADDITFPATQSRTTFLGDVDPKQPVISLSISALELNRRSFDSYDASGAKVKLVTLQVKLWSSPQTYSDRFPDIDTRLFVGAVNVTLPSTAAAAAQATKVTELTGVPLSNTDSAAGSQDVTIDIRLTVHAEDITCHANTCENKYSFAAWKSCVNGADYEAGEKTRHHASCETSVCCLATPENDSGDHAPVCSDVTCGPGERHIIDASTKPWYPSSEYKCCAGKHFAEATLPVHVDPDQLGASGFGTIACAIAKIGDINPSRVIAPGQFYHAVSQETGDVLPGELFSQIFILPWTKLPAREECKSVLCPGPSCFNGERDGSTEEVDSQTALDAFVKAYSKVRPGADFLTDSILLSPARLDAYRVLTPWTTCATGEAVKVAEDATQCAEFGGDMPPPVTPSPSNLALILGIVAAVVGVVVVVVVICCKRRGSSLKSDDDDTQFVAMT
jgi:hypothetical protein